RRGHLPKPGSISAQSEPDRSFIRLIGRLQISPKSFQGDASSSPPFPAINRSRPAGFPTCPASESRPVPRVSHAASPPTILSSRPLPMSRDRDVKRHPATHVPCVGPGRR
ncbi:unnamed protein product, partial [Ixodes persulcatus]